MARDLSDVITRLSASIAAGDKNPHYRRAAALTGGFPVYADIGGVLVIARDGEVVCVDLEQDVATRETDDRWRLLALAIAGRSQPELAELLPPRPSTARACELCAGTGMVHGFHCGICHHLGWVTGREVTTPLDDLLRLNPHGYALRRSALANALGRSPRQLLRTGTEILEDRTAALCALYFQLRSPNSGSVRSVVENGLLTGVVIWLEILDRNFQVTPGAADFHGAVRLLVDLWRTIASKAEQPVVSVIPLMTTAFVVSTALRAAYAGTPLFGRVGADIALDSRVLASLCRCEGLGELVREARSLITR